MHQLIPSYEKYYFYRVLKCKRKSKQMSKEFNVSVLSDLPLNWKIFAKCSNCFDTTKQLLCVLDNMYKKIKVLLIKLL